ncbi:thioredoxin fold domain-containing protein [Thioalkalicoccus limnaeus]|uniref:Thioredoxin fold domain-containing protein n=1 Tax=Thioalkalicoccus limnaeus TaxID=120681 RepID=A0ABV4BEN5_9GAMM
MVVRSSSRLFPLVAIAITLLLLVMSQAVSAARAQETIPPLTPGHYEIPGWFKLSFLDLAEDVEEATADGKRLMIMFHQEGCPYCTRMVDNLALEPIETYFRHHFDAVEINLWGDREVVDFDGEVLIEKEFAERYRVWATPTLLFFNEEGRQVLRLDGFYDPPRFLAALRYVGERQEANQSFRDYLDERDARAKAADQLATDPFFAEPPFRLDQDQLVAVFFEAPDCPACQALRDEIQRYRQTRDALARFHRVRLHRHAETPVITPNGQETTSRAWADEMEISYLPTLVLFDRAVPVMHVDAQFSAFHLNHLLDYVSEGAYRQQPNFQRFLHDRVGSGEEG